MAWFGCDGTFGFLIGFLRYNSRGVTGEKSSRGCNGTELLYSRIRLHVLPKMAFLFRRGCSIYSFVASTIPPLSHPKNYCNSNYQTFGSNSYRDNSGSVLGLFVGSAGILRKTDAEYASGLVNPRLTTLGACHRHPCDRTREMIRMDESSTVRMESTQKGKARCCQKRAERER